MQTTITNSISAIGNCNRDGRVSVFPKGEPSEPTPIWSPLFKRLCDISCLPAATENGLRKTQLAIGGKNGLYCHFDHVCHTSRLYAEKQYPEALRTQEFGQHIAHEPDSRSIKKDAMGE